MKRRYISLSLASIITISMLSGCSNISMGSNKNLVAQWNFNEGSGEVLNNVITNSAEHINYVFNEQNQQSLFKEASDPLWSSKGISGGSLLFDGYSTYIEDENFNIPTEEITISTWVAPRAFEWGDEGKLSSFVSQGSKTELAGINFGMYRHGSWSLQLGVGDDLLTSWIEIWDNDNLIPANEWSHVAATYNTKDGKATLYLNGTVVSEEVFSEYAGKSIKLSEDVFTIGKTNNNVRLVGVFDLNMYNGLMDELEIYNKALSSEEIKKKYDEVASSSEGVPEIAYEDIALDPELYATDRYRPQFHAMPGGHWMNEPHAPIYYNGKYHLFYQHNPTGPYWHQIHWGHWVSDDMVNWENVEVAIAPTEGDITPDGVWTGSATYDRDGIPVLFFTAGNDAKTPNQSIGMARPKDSTDPYLTEWEIYDSIIVAQTEGQGDFGEFRDPYVWFDEESDKYFMLVASGTNNGSGGTALIYSSTDLFNWEFHGNVYESDYSKYKKLGEHWELPVILPVKSEDGSIEKDIFIISPHGNGADVEVYYWLGEFDAETARFIPEHEEPLLMDNGDGMFTGPSGYVDPNTGRSILFTIAQGQDRSSWEDYYSGWAHTAGLPVSLYLDNSGKLNYKPIEELQSLRNERLVQGNDITLEEANAMLSSVNGDMLEIILEIENVNSNNYGIKVRKHEKDAEYTSIYCSEDSKELILDRINSSMDKTGLGLRKAPLEKIDGVTKIHIYLDRSLLEIYGNDNTSITSRIYPTLEESMGVQLFSDGEVKVKNLEVYNMKSVFTDEVKAPYYN